MTRPRPTRLDLAAALVVVALLALAAGFQRGWRALDAELDARLTAWERNPGSEEPHVSQTWSPPAPGAARMFLAREGWVYLCIAAGAWIQVHTLGRLASRLPAGPRAGVLVLLTVVVVGFAIAGAQSVPRWVCAWLAPDHLIPPRDVVGLSAAAPLVLWMITVSWWTPAPAEEATCAV